MLVRLLIVLLAILNLGVGLWWGLKPPASPTVPEPATEEPASGAVPSLVLVDGDNADAALDGPTLETHLTVEAMPDAPLEVAGQPAPQDVPATPPAAAEDAVAVAVEPATPAPEPPPTPVPAVPAPVCARIGPFADEASLAATRQRLANLLGAYKVAWQQTATTSVWRVWVPPQGSREQADAMAKRIAAAGFSDYFVIRQGDQAHAVALGQFRQEQGANRRRDALVAAGFPAEVVRSDTAVSRATLQVRLADGASLGGLRARAGKDLRVDSIDCAQVR